MKEEIKKMKGSYKIVVGKKTIELDEIPVVIVDLNKRERVEAKGG